MVKSDTSANARSLEKDLEWLGKVLDVRLKGILSMDLGKIRFSAPQVPESTSSVYSDFIEHYKLSNDERLLLLVALVPHVRPQLLDPLFIQDKRYNKGFTEFGGLHGQQHGGFLPTGETFLFLAAGNDLGKRFDLARLFSSDHFFAAHQVLHLEPAPDGEPFLSGALVLSKEYVDLFTLGYAPRPDFSAKFPARRIQTALGWDDLVLGQSTLDQIGEIMEWLEHGHSLMEDWGMKKRLRKGFRSLFYGPPGTGKSLTACLLGKQTGRDVYRIDLSLVTSKYIGETEKNLSRIFDQAQHKNWILFFDEADALFGKRTEVSDAHDRYANQEVSYLLQRIEDHDGVVILASNMKENMDDAFTRRFESIIYFPMPKPEQRLRIWKDGFSDSSKLSGEIDLADLARQYELSGGAIMNVVRYASLKALSRHSSEIRSEELFDGIKKEFEKEGRTV
jgi:AAA+ superfamily predicted ATPase